MVVALAAIVLLLSGTKTYAQLAAAAAAALVPGALLAALGRASPFSRNIAPSFVLVLGGLLLAGHLYASLTAAECPAAVGRSAGVLAGGVARREPLAHVGSAGCSGWRRSPCRRSLATGLAARKFLIDAATGY